MKQNLLRKFWLRVCMLVAVVLCGAGSAWATDIALTTNAITIEDFSPIGSSYVNPASDKTIGGYTWSVYQCMNLGKYSGVTYNNLQMKSGVGTFTSPTITSSYGFTVTVTYSSTKSLTLQIGEETAQQGGTTNSNSQAGTGATVTATTTSQSTSFKISAGSATTYVSSIVITPTSSGTQTVVTPTFSPAAGTYTSAQSVTISTTTSGATIYYTTDGADPTTSSSVYSGAISVSETTTIKAMAVKSGMENSSVAEATYTILGHAGTETDPYTVADARAAIDANTGIANVYATGIVTAIPYSYTTNNGITFNFVDNEGDDNFLQAYKCTGDDAPNVQVGDVVVVSGNLTKYGSTYEFGQGCTLVSRTSSSTQVSADLSFSASTANADLANLPAFTAPTLNNPHNLAITYTSSNTDVATVASDGQLNILAEGSTKITASSEETDEYLEGSAYYWLNVTNSNKQLVTVDDDGNITFDFTDNGWGFPTSKQVEEGSYTSDGYTIHVAGSDGNGFYFYSTSKAILMGKSGAYLTLPAFTFPVEKIEVQGVAGASSSVGQNIFVGTTAVSTGTIGATGTNTYVIADDYQAAGNVYKLKVTNSYNTQIKKIKVYKAIVDEREEAEIAFSVETLNITQGDEYTAPTFSNPNEVAVSFTSYWFCYNYCHL